MITQKYLQSLFFYNSKTGELTWKTLGRNFGQIAGSENKGYKRIQINKKLYGCHRIVWIIINGSDIPKGMEIDHINRNPLDNRIENLRLVTRSENMMNTKIFSTNKTGHKGVYWNKKSKKWHATIIWQKKRINLGFFDSLIEAVNARFQYEKSLAAKSAIFTSI